MEDRNKAVIFDLDGTIVVTEEYHFEAFRDVFKDHGIDYTERMHKEIYTGTGSRHIFETEFEKAGVDLKNIETALKKKQKIYRKLVDKRGLPLVEGVEDFLDECHAEGLIIGIATSTGPKNASMLLTETALLPYFEVVITIEDIIHAKPEPDIFLYTAGRLAVKPKETVVFEDSPRGIESAERGGFATVGLTTTSTKKKLEEKGADLTAKDYTKVDMQKIIRLKNTRKFNPKSNER